jgi:hypothetical protein
MVLPGTIRFICPVGLESQTSRKESIMGSGSYSYEAHRAITASQAARPAEKVFVQKNIHPQMNPFGVKFRESRDSVAHPESLGIFLTLDETGSMGHIPKLLAQESLPQFMQAVLDMGILHPQVLFAGVGDCHGDDSPLQIGQFESEASLINQWLTYIHLEGGGDGGRGAISNHESYDLAMYFAAHHTSLDCWEKRQKKGYFILIGDEVPYARTERGMVNNLIGDALVDDSIPITTVVEELSRTYHPFFIIPDRGRARDCERAWRDLLGDHVIVANDPKDIVYLAASVIGLTEGTVRSIADLRSRLQQLGLTSKQLADVTTAITPYADSLGVASVPDPVLGPVVGSNYMMGTK